MKDFGKNCVALRQCF